MDFLDDDGRLFGLINIIDALVILLVFAVIVAGAALVFSEEPEPEPNLGTTYATLDLGTQPEYIVSAINEGDSYSPNGNSKITVTDVFLTPLGDERRVLLRVKLQGKHGSELIQYNDAPPRLGRDLTIATDLYKVSGQIRQVGGGPSLEIQNTTVVLSDRLPRIDARSIAPGDQVTLSGRTVASVEDVAVYPTDDPSDAIVFVEASLDAYQSQGEIRFGGTPIRRGQTISLPEGDYTITGEIESVSEGLSDGSAEVLVRQTVDSEVASRIATGDVATVADHEIATVESVNVYGTQDPDQKQVFLGLSIQTLEFGEREFFGTSHVRKGTLIPISTQKYDFSGRVQRVGSLTQPGTPATKTVVLQMSDIPEQMANALEPGMTERSGEHTIAQVTNISTRPSIVLIRGQEGKLGVFDHPINREVTITATIQARDTVSGVRFKGNTIQQGSQITLDLGSTTISGRVISIR